MGNNSTGGPSELLAMRKHGISPDLNARLHDTLSRCGTFDSNRALYALFVDERIIHWKNKIPEATNKEERITYLIDALYNQYDTDGANALALFLSVMSDKHSLADSCSSDLRRLSETIDPMSMLPPPDPAKLACWDNASFHYNQFIIDNYNTTHIFGQPQAVSLDDIYTDLALLDRPSAFRRFDIQQLEHDPGVLDNALRISTETLLRSGSPNRFFILGKPGAGKTTLLKHLALRLAAHTANKVPIFVSLKEWVNSSQSLLPYITVQFKACDIPDADHYVMYLLKQTNRAVVLLDGLDEVRQEGDQRRKTIAALQTFATRFPSACVIITCRVAATDYTFERFIYFEVADFTPGQVKTFVRKWFHENPAKGEDFLNEINRKQHRGLRELARQPLLLAMLCLAFNDTLTFPARRVEIYYDALDALLRKWDSSRNIRRDTIYQGLSIGRKRQMFARLAAETFKKGEYFIPQEHLENAITDYLHQLPRAEVAGTTEIDSTGVLQAIEAQHGILVERAHRIHSFAHLTFQEYYTAENIIERTASDLRAIPDLLTHAHEDRWREVILLTTSRLDNADAFFQHFLNALDAYVQDDPHLIAFFNWITRKTTESSCPPTDSVACRASYAWIVFVLAQKCDPRWALSYALNRAGVVETTRKKESDSILNRVVSRAYDLAHNLVLLRNNASLVLDYSLSLVLILLASRIQAHQFALSNTGSQHLRDALTYACDRAHDLNLNALAGDLAQITIPSPEIEGKDWDTWISQLQSLILQHRDIGHNWNFTAEQLRILEHYFIATELLLECLNLAYITNHTTIEARLLCSPTPKGFWDQLNRWWFGFRGMR